MNAYLNMWKNGINFKDRTSRKDYWIAIAISFVIGFIINIIEGALDNQMVNYIFLIYYIPFFVVSLALTVRRLHDVNKSGWYLLIGLLVYIITYVIFASIIYTQLLKNANTTNSIIGIYVGLIVGFLAIMVPLCQSSVEPNKYGNNII